MGSLQVSPVNNTNIGGSSGHAGKNIGRLEAVGWHSVHLHVTNKTQNWRLDGAGASGFASAPQHLLLSLIQCRLRTNEKD